ncbi:MAG TPA: 3'-5' exonuclease, partial [Candidatus Peribacteraceae bacterium]|nr:3'-5' exonuclease [Candidatus Peribacteraceae bacterium]
MKLPLINFVVLDTETTGFVPKVHKVIEYAAVRVEDGAIVDTYEQLLWTEEVPPVVEALTRIRTLSLQGQPRFRDAQADIEKHMGTDTLIVGQNILFDINMLKGEGLDLSDRPWIDTSMLASIVFPELESYSLGYLSRVLKLDHEPKHRALGDVKATLGLLAACWERMQELTPEFQEVAQLIAGKSTPGYKMLFDALPKAKKKKKPKWLTLPRKLDVPVSAPGTVTLPTPARGTVQLVEETLEPKLLEQLIASCAQDKTAQHWIAVKNLEATVARERFPEKEVRILYPPFLLPDSDAVKMFAAQDIFTADEATLAMKLAWYEPAVQSDLPIHGGEEAVWNGKLASSDRSKIYMKQFEDLPGVVLLDHRQLLAFLADPEHSAHDILGKDAHVIITDASMLEDTATKAYGWHTSVDDLRAGVEGNAELRKFVDLLQLWIEKVRNFQDLRYITKNDLGTPETKGLRDQLEHLLQDESFPLRMQRLLRNLYEFLEPEVLPDRIAWIETRQNGSQYLESVPDRIGNMLREHLYGKFPTSLLIPPGSEDTLKETLPIGTETAIARPMFEEKTMQIELPEQRTLEMYLTDPPVGKTILLLPSRGAIVDMYVKHVERLETEGVTMLCQGVSGGQGRMQAEFLVSEGTTLWLMTPW